MTTKKKIVLMGVGDIGPVHGEMEPYSTMVRPILATADIRFGQCERLYSENRGNKNSNANFGALKPHMVSIFTDSGFDVVSLAGNHTMEYGPEVVLDTIELFRQKGIQLIGAGRNLREARRPAIIEKNGVKVAFLAYCSILKEGYEAGPNKVGVAPMRAHTAYEPYEYQAGVPPRVVTTPYEEDLQGMVEDITEAKKAAHVVVVSFHWGIHFIPRLIAEYQIIAAKAAFKAGADLILGHHAHVPKAIEIQNGKACFYSLGNFMFTTNIGVDSGFHERLKIYGVTPDFDQYPNCPHGKDSHRSLIAKAVLSRDGVEKVSFLPVQIDQQLRPEVLRHGDPRFNDNLNFIECASEGYNHKFKVEGDEVVVTG